MLNNPIIIDGVRYSLTQRNTLSIIVGYQQATLLKID